MIISCRQLNSKQGLSAQRKKSQHGCVFIGAYMLFKYSSVYKQSKDPLPADAVQQKLHAKAR